MSRYITYCLVALSGVLLLLLPLLVNPGLVHLAGVTLVMGVFAVAWNLLFGYAGLASFGSGGLFSLGAYVMAISLRAGYEQSFLLLIVLAMVTGGIVAFLVGAVALRRSSGIYLAILTLAMAEVLRQILMRWHWIGAEDGLPNIVRPHFSYGLGLIDLSSGARYHVFLCLACGLLIAAIWWIAHGRFGRTLRAIRLDPERAAFMGVNTYGYKLAAFTLSGVFVAGAGALYAPLAQIVTPDLGNMLRSTQPILFTLLGGASSFWGPLIGGFLFSAIEYGTRTLVGLQEIITGVILLAVVLIFPTGISGAFRKLFASLEQGEPAPARKVEVSDAGRLGKPLTQRV
ncbi:branched-chain amino acid ABC transporter permease [Corticibacterium sp. UT-5YL-CI-8]|nr:branched-chain amino acid ABC transporter permease [Tianweitania sp. UT-5YL-CI-8]